VIPLARKSFAAPLVPENNGLVAQAMQYASQMWQISKE
jgi:hypothetical protein